MIDGNRLVEALSLPRKAHKKAFSSSKFKPRCLEAQLKEYIDEACNKNANLRAVGGHGQDFSKQI